MAYIERESAIKSLLNDCLGQVSYSREDAADCIFWLDTADVVPARHGRWLHRKMVWPIAPIVRLTLLKTKQNTAPTVGA